MKITMNIDGALLDRVVVAMGAKNRTAAVDLALREIDRKARLLKLTEEGLGLSKSELGTVFDPDYDVLAARVAESTASYAPRKRPRR